MTNNISVITGASQEIFFRRTIRLDDRTLGVTVAAGPGTVAIGGPDPSRRGGGGEVLGGGGPVGTAGEIVARNCWS